MCVLTNKRYKANCGLGHDLGVLGGGGGAKFEHEIFDGAPSTAHSSLICDMATFRKKSFDLLTQSQWPMVHVRTEYVLAWFHSL